MISMTRQLGNKLGRPNNLFVYLLLLSLVVRVLASFAIGLRETPYSLDEGDEREYAVQAYFMVHGLYSVDFRRPIGYVSYLAFLDLITFENFKLIQLANVAVFSLTAPMTYLLVRRVIGNVLVAGTVGLLVIFWPPFLYYGRTFYSETATLPLMTLFLALIPRGSVVTREGAKGWLPWFLSGSLLGLCSLFRPMYLLFFPFFALILLCEERSRKSALTRIIVSLLGFALVILPYSIYLSAKIGGPVLVSTTGVEVFAQGLNPDLIQKGYQFTITPEGRVVWSGPGKITVPIEDTGFVNGEELNSLPVPQLERLISQRAIEWVVGHPGSALYLEVMKLLYMWGFYPVILEKETLLLNFVSIACLGLGIAALVRFRGHTRLLARFWVLPVYASATALISWGSWRFREVGDLGVLALSTLFLLSLKISPSRLLSRQQYRQHLEP
jgi:4-amino-4-deoxy-L-arabinose transferase-like glycosyltransferase